MSLKGKVIYYILTGARKSAEARYNITILREFGAEVYVILSQGAEKIVNKKELEQVSGHFVRNSFVKEHPDHSLPLEDIVIMAPATYNSINKIANGIADTLATSLVATAIGRGTPTYIAPAMNFELWNNPILQQNIEKLRSCGIKIIHPQVENKKSTMAERLKVLDTVIHDFERIRYESIALEDEPLLVLLKNYRNEHFQVFKEIGKKLEDLKLNSGTAGCISIRLNKGFLITTSGSKLGSLEEKDISWVLDCDEQGNKVWWCGENRPSSETPLHYVLYQRRSDIQAVLHTHCHNITYADSYKMYRSQKYYSYGTFEFGHNITQEMVGEKQNFITSKDHGQIVIGNNLEQTVRNFENIIKNAEMNHNMVL